MRKVLVLEDEDNIRSFVVLNLNRAGYDTLEADHWGGGAGNPEGTPGDPHRPAGRARCPASTALRSAAASVPPTAKMGIIMLTARTQEMDKVTGLMTGADDYVTKPFSPAELTARVDALYRRTGGDEKQMDSGEIAQPPFLLNTRNRTLEKNGKRIKLTQVEYSIIKLFMDNPGKALSREEILDSVWGRDYYGEAEDRGREHPPPAPEDRGRPHQSHLHHHRLGLWLQMGVLMRTCPASLGGLCDRMGCL